MTQQRKNTTQAQNGIGHDCVVSALDVIVLVPGMGAVAEVEVMAG
jgi:hypothetical protein